MKKEVNFRLKTICKKQYSTTWCERGMRPLLRRGDILDANYEMMIDSSLIDKSHKVQTSQRASLSFLKGKKETKTPSTNPNKGQISFLLSAKSLFCFL